ncbi:MAG: peptide chain release factor 2 [Candidatus Eisenbacteria bacterium]|uniref:Peptide chain release factor 2 n=1 Tax=Eiseniibacteriota bacterium TaxID=2212470 RepID=A0A849SW47_UNCEI|nr:peptide chain release factor 2 [Candidatus Eisenbacteria bacterium]
MPPPPKTRKVPCSPPPNFESASTSPARASTACGGTFDIEGCVRTVAALESRMAEPGFWDRAEEAQRTVQELKRAKGPIDQFGARDASHRNLAELLDLAEAESDESMLREVEQELTRLEAQVADLETRSLLSGPHDRLGALITIHPGAGGTESQDWAEMLLRMYQRWAERHEYKLTMLDYQAGDEAGIKDATLEIDGEFAYGYIKAESGVHRLVRISPYDANARRHTSFSSVMVLPMIDDTIKLDIAPGDLRIDTMRAGGAGGQHVNKTESAVRITHLPSGLVVQSQAERSQHRNKDAAMKILMARLFVLKEAEAKAKTSAIAGPKKDIDFGSQIRSYVLQPYTMANDHRTELKIPDVHGVLDGKIDPFIDAWLKRKDSDA